LIDFRVKKIEARRFFITALGFIDTDWLAKNRILFFISLAEFTEKRRAAVFG
jgi:hypothetical protein